MGEIIDKVKGKIKQAGGALSGDKKLTREGKLDEAKGNAKGAVEDVKHAVKDAVRKRWALAAEASLQRDMHALSWRFGDRHHPHHRREVTSRSACALRLLRGMKASLVAALMIASVAACREASIAPGLTSVVVSSSFPAGSPIPADFTCDGANRSPRIAWTSVSESAKSVAIVVDDIAAPGGAFTHWIVWNINPSRDHVDVGATNGVVGTNDFGRAAYNGPCPPKGRSHNYRFAVYGLDAPLDLKPTDTRAAFERAISSHIVAQGDMIATYQRP
jgi:Raf kinase inhibitor-like YbhB/YbcL family protein